MSQIIDNAKLVKQCLEIKPEFEQFPRYLDLLMDLVFVPNSTEPINLDIDTVLIGLISSSNILSIINPNPILSSQKSLIEQIDDTNLSFRIGAENILFTSSEINIRLFLFGENNFESVDITTINLPANVESSISLELLVKAFVTILQRTKLVNPEVGFITGAFNEGKLTEAGAVILNDLLTNNVLLRRLLQDKDTLRRVMERSDVKSIFQDPSLIKILPKQSNIEFANPLEKGDEMLRLTDVLLPCLSIKVGKEIMYLVRKSGFLQEKLEVYTEVAGSILLIKEISFK